VFVVLNDKNCRTKQKVVMSCSSQTCSQKSGFASFKDAVDKGKTGYVVGRVKQQGWGRVEWRG
jgi:hypothetical protein